MSNDSERDAVSQITTDEETIRTWAEARDAAPFRHRTAGHYRVLVRDEADESHERVEWTEFATHLEADEHVVVYRGEGAAEPLAVLERADALERSGVDGGELAARLDEGETVTTEMVGETERGSPSGTGETADATGPTERRTAETAETAEEMDAAERPAPETANEAMDATDETDAAEEPAPETTNEGGTPGPADESGTSPTAGPDETAAGNDRRSATGSGADAATAGPAAGEAMALSTDELGKDVLDADGETVGMVTDVAEDGTRLYVDPEPGVTERIKAALDWGDADENDYPVASDRIDDVTRDAVRLKDAGEIDETTPAA